MKKLLVTLGALALAISSAWAAGPSPSSIQLDRGAIAAGQSGNVCISVDSTHCVPFAKVAPGNVLSIIPGAIPPLSPPTATVLGGVKSLVPVSHMWMTGIDANGAPTIGQPDFSDVTGKADAATQCNFTPVGTGGVTRPCSAPFQDALTVNDFGAVADGNTTKTDNLTKFQNAAAAGVLRIPNGYYYVSCGILTTNNVRIVGNGRGNSYTLFGGGSSYLDANGRVNLTNCPTRPLVLGGTAIAKLGFAANTYSGGTNVGSALTVGGSPSNSTTPLNTLDTPFVAGDTITVGATGSGNGAMPGGTITVVPAWYGGPATISIASPAVITTPSAHGLAANQAVVFSTSGALPTGLTAGTTYYVVGSSITSTTFQVSATVGGSAIATSGTQSGFHRMTTPGSGAVAVNQVAVNDPLWKVWDEIDSLSCSGNLFCHNASDGFRTFIAENFQVGCTVSAPPCGRVFDVQFPAAYSFGYTQAVIKNVHVITGSTVAFRSFSKLVNIWFPVLGPNYFTGLPIMPRNDGSYNFYLTGGSGAQANGYSSVGASIAGNYSGSQYGVIFGGYVEGLNFESRTNFISCTYCIYGPATVPLGGAGIFASAAITFQGLDTASTNSSVYLNNSQEPSGQVHLGSFGSLGGWIGLYCSGCTEGRINALAENGNAGSIGAVLTGGQDMDLRLTTQAMQTPFYLDSNVVRARVAGHGFNANLSGSGGPDAFVNLSPSSYVDWRPQNAAPYGVDSTSATLTPAAGSDDKQGTFSVTTGATSLNLFFRQYKANPPVCTWFSPTGATVTRSYAGTTGAGGGTASDQVTFPSAPAGAQYSYVCSGS